MKPIGQAAKAVQRNEGATTSAAKGSSSPLSTDAERALAAIWVEFENLWPALWRPYRGEPGGEVYQAWQRTLAGLEPRQLNRGLDAVRRSGRVYPPDAVEFRRLCRATPAALGMPDAMTALNRAVRRDWQPAAVWHGVRRMREIGWSHYDMRTAAQEAVLPDWQRVWARMLDEIDAGAEFELPEPAGPPLPSAPLGIIDVSPEEARANLDRMRRRMRRELDPEDDQE
jgi:hypothetical protein